MNKVIPFTKKAVKEYLDKCILYWRKKKKEGCVYAHYYIDAFQSVRVSLFGKTLEKKEE